MARIIPTFSAIEPEKARAMLPFAQVAIYVMVGGGFNGKHYAEQPATAYLDDRAKGAYGRRDIEAARLSLINLAKVAGYDPKELPAMPEVPHMGVL
jgi:hypothetical protein